MFRYTEIGTFYKSALSLEFRYFSSRPSYYFFWVISLGKASQEPASPWRMIRKITNFEDIRNFVEIEFVKMKNIFL